ncbi:hypothetical protein XACN24_14695 [Xanthomonas albilineans]|uniref:hypothetical protein n=1 Tax=Xanthomonas albilineans TaxID=29447 RepID=UPI000677D165|nr:hypothetical protein [Xanthomonas albilineans]PPU91790.1 hypothetical protein XalbCFBP2523_13575 [Xanthomonas albilineans]QHQ29717.1 hypothetical protein XaFJ1_GM003008 [Xanthomonas albilineans]
MRLIKQQCLASGSAYGHCKATQDLRDLNESYSRLEDIVWCARKACLLRQATGASHVSCAERHARWRAIYSSRFEVTWRRKPKLGALVHSDQDSVYTRDDEQSFLTAHSSNGDLSPLEFERRYAQRRF